jgi:hypothetical protein
MTFGRVIFGDNQFLGINHASPSKALQMQNKFGEPDAIIEVIGFAYEAGIRDFMFTTHDRLEPVFREIIASKLFPDMSYIPCLPYVHKYANAYSEHRLFPIFLSQLSGCSKIGILKSLLQLLGGNVGGGMGLLVEIEMLMMRGLNVRGVFLQNVLFDLIMGLHCIKLIEVFHQYVANRFNAIPGYITINHGLAQNFLIQDVRITMPWITSFFNVDGYRMHPNQKSSEESFSNGLSKNIAMSIFASGILKPDLSIEYVKKFHGVESILFGSSNRLNIERNIQLIQNVRN